MNRDRRRLLAWVLILFSLVIPWLNLVIPITFYFQPLAIVAFPTGIYFAISGKKLPLVMTVVASFLCFILYLVFVFGVLWNIAGG